MICRLRSLTKLGPPVTSAHTRVCTALTVVSCLSLQSWLKAPLVEPAAIRQRLDIVEAFVTDQALREGVRDALRGETSRPCHGPERDTTCTLCITHCSAEPGMSPCAQAACARTGREVVSTYWVPGSLCIMARTDRLKLHAPPPSPDLCPPACRHA